MNNDRSKNDMNRDSDAGRSTDMNQQEESTTDTDMP